MTDETSLPQTPAVIINPPHRSPWTERWRHMRGFWSIHIGVMGIILLTGVPALSDQFPNIAPSLVAWFPKHGQQWVPVAGAVLAIVARILSQEYVASKLRQIFRIQGN